MNPSVKDRIESSVVAGPAPTATSDRDLLDRFAQRQEENAFAELVVRHGPLVMAVCRRVLGKEHDAEDAFQATFLVLARKAGSVRRENSLGAWLYKTAFRIALRARAKRSRRPETSLETDPMIADSLSQISQEHEQAVLDQELNALPEKYRLPLFLCCLEGKSRDEAAEQLGWSIGALKGRLERGRQLLRRKLLLRGVSLAVVLSLIVRSSSTAAAASSISPSLLAATVQAGVRVAAGQSLAGQVSAQTLSLTHRSIEFMSLTSAKILVGSFCCVAALTTSAQWLPAPAFAGAANALDAPIQLVSQPVARGTQFIAFGEEEGAPRRSAEGDAGPRRSAEGDAGPRRSAEGDAGPRRSAEGDAGPRRSAEGDAGPRRSAEGDAGPRRSAEGDAGPRRSAEGDAGPRRSAEGDAGPRRSAEGDAGPRRSVEGERNVQAGEGLGGFRPQSPREAALFQMILQLQQEVTTLRREVQGNPQGRADGEPRNATESAGVAPANWQRTKEGGVFKAYDQNGDLTVTADEWLRMKRVSATDTARIKLETGRFQEADPNNDGKMTVEEFLYWYTQGRFNATEGPARGQGDGGRAPTGLRDGERAPSGLRDGERAPSGLRDGQ
ncbi:sigma-70 family RNA polymerase sigma factor [Lignipirellula cremea]|uniref:ECF RNA polymerase sigma factor SigW n=1 Tax=Lignipirellula cremea TaxID=2528010 RepID=A0A518DXR8_9BACT|nr:sigma-70 family RNA polymerase sigma factor [Lignipirellula cremea]QDU96638.1 ECF RNA polymerase sigma factor SigW [Lignipirellula cremea]